MRKILQHLFVECKIHSIEVTSFVKGKIYLCEMNFIPYKGSFKDFFLVKFGDVSRKMVARGFFSAMLNFAHVHVRKISKRM